jgi:ATP-dependent DNA ligase
LIEEIAAESGRLEKEKLLAELAATDEGKFVLKWTYDPFITYGVTPPRQPGTGKFEFRPSLVKPLLEKLAARKLTGNAAQAEIAECMNVLNERGAELLWRILSKDLKCGIGDVTIKKMAPGLVPTFSVMRAHKFEEKRIKKWPQIVEPKLDGYRFTFLCRGGHGGFFSRSGIRQPAADHLVEPMIATAFKAAHGSEAICETLAEMKSFNDDRANLNFMADGEMLMDGHFNENGALRRQDEQAEGAKFHIFDLMPYADFDAVGSVGRPYMERRTLVEEFVKHAATPEITKTPRYFANSFEDIHNLYGMFRERGLEGAMVKNPEGLYDKKKSYGWLKIKAEESEDLPIVGAYPGEPNTKYEHCLGGAIVRRPNGVEVRVGGGWSDQQREEVWKAYQEDLAELERNGATLEDPSFDGRPRFLLRMIEVLYHEETPDGSLRHPRFKCFRDDKAGEVEEKVAA